MFTTLLFYNLDKNMQDDIYILKIYFHLDLQRHDVRVKGALYEGRLTAMLLFLILINEGWENKFFPLYFTSTVNPLNAQLNHICHLLALLGAHHILHVSRIRDKDKLSCKIYTCPTSTPRTSA